MVPVPCTPTYVVFLMTFATPQLNSSAPLFLKKKSSIEYSIICPSTTIMWNKIGWKAKRKRRGGRNGLCRNVTCHWHHVGLPMIVIRWHFQPPEVPQKLNYEFATPESSHLFLGRNVDQTQESSGNRAYKPLHFFFFFLSLMLTFYLVNATLDWRNKCFWLFWCVKFHASTVVFHLYQV